MQQREALKAKAHEHARPGESRVFGCRLTLAVGAPIVERIVRAAAAREGGYVCVANTHEVLEARRSHMTAAALDGALAVTTDSRVLHRALELLGEPCCGELLYGPDLLDAVVSAACNQGLRIGLFGSTPFGVAAVKRRIELLYPSARVVYAHSPEIASAEVLAGEATLSQIAQSGCDVLLVALGCPKQEIWMHLAAPSISCCLIGLGGAFDFFSGVRRRSPAWVHTGGLEWAYRLLMEPNRLWKRYAMGNIRFAVLFLKTVIMRYPEKRV